MTPRERAYWVAVKRGLSMEEALELIDSVPSGTAEETER
jgi:hypothetical protein